MAQVPLNYGLSVEDGTGDPLRTTFEKIQGNLTDLDTRLTATTALTGTLGTAAFRNVGITTGSVADGGALASEITRAMSAEQTNASAIANETSRAQGVELLKAPIASPALTGIPTAPTATNGTNSNQIATCAFVLNNAGSGGGGGGGGTGGVPPTRQINTTGLLTGGGDLTTDRTFDVPAATQSDVATGTDQTKALTAYSIAAALGAKAPLASPQFVGTPVAPTAAAGDNSTRLATTAYVDRAAPAAPYIVAESLGATGYRKWSDGVIQQWGILTSNGGDSVVTLPIAFPTACDRAFGGTTYIPDPTAMFNVNVAPNGLTQIRVSPRITYGQSVAAFASGAPLFWEAWGR